MSANGRVAITCQRDCQSSAIGWRGIITSTLTLGYRNVWKGSDMNEQLKDRLNSTSEAFFSQQCHPRLKFSLLHEHHQSSFDTKYDRYLLSFFGGIVIFDVESGSGFGWKAAFEL